MMLILLSYIVYTNYKNYAFNEQLGEKNKMIQKQNSNVENINNKKIYRKEIKSCTS